MDCALVRNHLDAYVDGELEPSPSATLETHLHACPLCRDELSVSRALKRAVHDLPRPALPESLRVDIIRALDRGERDKDGAGRRNMAFTASLAVAAAALLYVVAVKRPEPPPLAGNEPRVPGAAIFDPTPINVGWGLPSDIKELDPVWLSNKTGFRVPRVEFPRSNVQFSGARIGHVGDQPAALLSYTTGNNRLTVAVYQPTQEVQRMLHDDELLTRLGGKRARAGSHLVTYQNVRGYTVSVLEKGGLAYSFVSDLDEQSLLQLIGSARLP